MLFVLMLIPACGKKGKNDTDDGTTVFEYGDNKVSKAEVYIYLNTVKERYEDIYGSEIWNISLPEGEDETSMELLTREEVIADIVRVKTFVAHAEEYDIRISETEDNAIKEKAQEFYKKLTDKDIEDMEMTEEMAYNVMYENLVASKVEQIILESAKIEISDEEARQTTFYDLFFPCYKKDSAGNIIEMTDEEKEQQYENALNSCSTLGTAVLDDNETGEDIENIAAFFRLEEGGEMTLSPEEIQDRYGRDVYEILYAMDNGEYSQVIETEYGYHVFEMIELTDQKATAEQKKIMTEEEKQKVLKKQLDEWSKEIDADFSFPDSINMDVYDSIKLAE